MTCRGPADFPCTPFASSRVCPAARGMVSCVQRTRRVSLFPPHRPAGRGVMFEPSGVLPPTVAAARPRVSLHRLTTYEPAAVDRALRAVLAPLGGMSAFVAPGARVVLKPNLLMPSAPERAICTHPEIVRAVARLAREAGAALVEATDSPGVGTATRCTRRLGLGDGDLVTVMDAGDGTDVAPPGAPFHRVRLIARLLAADLVINLPKAKTHGQMVMTAAVKNSFGAVVGMEKAQWHFRAGRSPEDFARLLVHVHGVVAPRLSILDAVVGMEGNGPSAGDPRPLGVLVASADAHALDAVLAQIWGLAPQQVFTLAVATRPRPDPPVRPDRDRRRAPRRPASPPGLAAGAARPTARLWRPAVALGPPGAADDPPSRDRPRRVHRLRRVRPRVRGPRHRAQSRRRRARAACGHRSGAMHRLLLLPRDVSRGGDPGVGGSRRAFVPLRDALRRAAAPPRGARFPLDSGGGLAACSGTSRPPRAAASGPRVLPGCGAVALGRPECAHPSSRFTPTHDRQP